MIVLLSLALFAPVLTMRDQSIAIRGQLRCHLSPLPNVVVELHEKRRGVFKNQVLARTKTDASGKFTLSGGTNRLLPVTPLLYVPKNCKGKEVSMKLNIAKTSVTKGKVPQKVVDVGPINLEILRTPPSSGSPTEDLPYIDVQ